MLPTASKSDFSVRLRVLPAMVHLTPCPNCAKVGFLHIEHVIHGSSSNLSCYCGSCDYEWTVVETSGNPTADIAANPADAPDATNARTAR